MLGFLVVVGLAIAIFACLSKRDAIPVAWLLAGALSLVFIISRYPWWVPAMLFLVASLVITAAMAEHYDLRRSKSILDALFATLIVAVAAAAITDQAMKNSAVKGDERVTDLISRISCDSEHYYMNPIEGYTASTDKEFPARDFPAPYVYYFLDPSRGDESLKGKWAGCSGMFPSSADIAGVKTVIVAVRYESDGYTYMINGNKNNTKSIYRKKGDLYFFDLETKQYHVMKEVVAGKLPNKSGGGRTDFTRYKLLGRMKDMYRNRPL